MPEKIDLYKTHKAEYAAKKDPALVTIGPAKYLTIDGKGEPGGEAFQASVAALYGVAYTIKMTRKFAGDQDYKVCALEGQWWVPNPCDWMNQPRDSWEWKLMIRVPEFITAGDLKAAVVQLKKRGKGAGADQVRLETIREGRSVQVLHVGPYAAEPETVARMHDFVRAQGLQVRGKHHEIYLNDPRRVPAERLRTILRHPVE